MIINRKHKIAKKKSFVMATLTVENVGMQFGEKRVLNNLSFTIQSGDIFCLLGQNGAGKTTTINILLGLYKPTLGKAMINGVSISDYSETRKYIAYIPEVVQLYGNLTGIENLKFFSELAEKKIVNRSYPSF